MDDMLKVYKERRREYEEKIHSDLAKIEDNIRDFVSVGDYFSVRVDENLVSIKAIECDGSVHLAVRSDDMDDFIAFDDLTLTENPDLILWIIQNSSLIEKGFVEVLINAVRNGENIVNTLKSLKLNYE